jgi:hypothetical protein
LTVGGSPPHAALGQGRNPVRRAASLSGFAVRNRNRPINPTTNQHLFPDPGFGRGVGKKMLFTNLTQRATEEASWPDGKRTPRSNQHGRSMCGLPTQGSAFRELREMPFVGRVREFPLEMFWKLSTSRERARVREHCMEGKQLDEIELTTQ